MTRNLITNFVIALFALQNLVFCCGHVHPKDSEETSGCQSPHVHFHAHSHHGHTHAHHHHHHHHDGQPFDERTDQNQHSHDCSIAALKLPAIIQNRDSLPTLNELIVENLVFARLSGICSPIKLVDERPAIHCHWHQSCSIILQVRALII